MILFGKKDIGNLGERIAAKHLRKNGYRILAKNVQCGKNELDIVAKTKECIAFVEVKTLTFECREAVDRRPARAVDVAKRRRTIEAASIAGAEWIVIHPAFFQEEPKVRYRKNLETFRSLAEFAKKCSIGLAIENLPGRIQFRDQVEVYPFTTAEELISLIDPLNEEFGNVGACWDTGHAGLTLNLAPQSEEIHRLGHRLKTLHIADNGGSFDDHLPPFYCRIDFKEIVEALTDIGFAGTFNFEAHNCCNKLPDELRIDAARMLYRIGEYIVTHYGKA
jgi:sugar phosphate isomerase/epimerase